MHAENPYQAPYDFTKYIEVYAPLNNYIVLNTSGQETIDFSDSQYNNRTKNYP